MYVPYFSCLQANVFLLAFQGRVTANHPSSLNSSWGFSCCAREGRLKCTFSTTSSIETMIPGLTAQHTRLSVYSELCSPQREWVSVTACMIRTQTICIFRKCSLSNYYDPAQIQECSILIYNYFPYFLFLY